MSDLELYGDFAVAGIGATVSLHAFTGELRARLVESSYSPHRHVSRLGVPVSTRVSGSAPHVAIRLAGAVKAEWERLDVDIHVRF